MKELNSILISSCNFVFFVDDLLFVARYNTSMPVSADLLRSARRYHTSAAASLLESYYPATHRLAYALCGDVIVGERIIHLVTKRALALLPRWRDETLPDRWFYHHTVLAARATTKATAAPPQNDPLIPFDSAAPYIAFIRTLRALPPQQKEVIILHYGERLNSRFLGIAMDCSADAATSHLIAATGSLGAINGDRFETLAKKMGIVYQALAPSPAAIATLRARVAQYVWPRRIWQWIYRSAAVAILIGIGVAGWHFRDLFK